MKVALKNLVEIKSGYSPSAFELMENGSIPYVKVEDMNNCTKYQNASREYCEDVDRSVPAGAIIFPKRGAAIMNNKVRITATDICMDTNMMAIIPNGKIQSEFLYYTIIYEKLSRIADTSTIPQINNKHINPYKIPLPPVPEQKAIADLLSTWDEAIEKTERLIQAKEKRFKWLINSLINATKDCEEIRLGQICTVTKGKQLNVAHMKDDGVYYALNGGIDPSGRTDDWNTEAETITISEGGNSCGYVNYNAERFWSGGHCYSLLRIKKNVDKHYLYFYLKMNEPKLMKLRVGSGLPNIQKKDVDKFIVALPSLDEQQQIAQSLSSARREIDLLKQLADKYKTQKRGLMQKMLTGEWRVKPEIVNQYMEA